MCAGSGGCCQAWVGGRSADSAGLPITTPTQIESTLEFRKTRESDWVASGSHVNAIKCALTPDDRLLRWTARHVHRVSSPPARQSVHARPTKDKDEVRVTLLLCADHAWDQQIVEERRSISVPF